MEDTEELLRFMFKISDDEEWPDFDELLYERYNVDREQFDQICFDLLDLATMGQSPLTQKVYKGFGSDKLFLIKKEVQP